ncbi:MAG: hypothetical protein GWN18_03265, partial [Thermoplasmata archaeon]|nr:hypothetical protein [Thermoplasmata archaeon]NIS14606.1 hypothetical protein [Thermoplasmata archaeon]NIS18977.1 hypothetical protein [Thermoplasmata archaeon]NIT80353.1 hypothetical protein [Thermoplasmata archaeon]NIU48127.1 hypothetical protein [Thermoplasmata archaeon]
VEGNTITNSSKDPIYVCSVSTSTTVKDNDIYDNKGNVDFRHSRGQVFSNNRLHNNSAPITLLNSNSMTFSGNVINGSTILLDRSTGVTFTNNEIIVDK